MTLYIDNNSFSGLWLRATPGERLCCLSALVPVGGRGGEDSGHIPLCSHFRLCLRGGRVVVKGPALEPDCLSLGSGAIRY